MDSDFFVIAAIKCFILFHLVEFWVSIRACGMGHFFWSVPVEYFLRTNQSQLSLSTVPGLQSEYGAIFQLYCNKDTTQLFMIIEREKFSNWPPVLWSRVWHETGQAWVQWVPSSPWDPGTRGGPTALNALEGPLVLDLLKQFRLVLVNLREHI